MNDYTRVRQDDGSFQYVGPTGIRMAVVREWTELGSYGKFAGAAYVAELYSCYQERPNRIQTVRHRYRRERLRRGARVGDGMKLHPVHGRAGKCGPSALAAIAGCTTDDAARAIRQYTGKRSVTRTSVPDMTGGLANLGWTCRANNHRKDPDGLPTVRRWIADMDRDERTAWIMLTAKHWIVLSWHDGSLYVADSGFWFSRTPSEYDGRANRRRVVRTIAVKATEKLSKAAWTKCIGRGILPTWITTTTHHGSRDARPRRT